ncbi:uncharacterized protein LOC110932469 [Helianthus annuus]|uniref:uncharacterized protein LOC110932469 n=1 Tax=Helianthus annuus TaxID=4232 RepID=UPI000B904993|nr:uncharacterized protein LOC110932469 [Helianthus annuus]
MSISVDSNNLSFVNDLNPEKDMWNMKARIIRKGNQDYKMDLIFINEKIIYVVGSVVCCGDLEFFGRPPKETKNINFDNQDLEGKVLRCTVWNDYAMQFKEFISKIPAHEHVMAVIQHGKCKEWKGEYTVQSDKFATRILILKFGQRSGSTSQTILSSQTVFPLHKEFECLVLCCVVVATIKIVQEEYGWFYPVCHKCFKKLMAKSEYLQNVKNVSDDIVQLPATSLVCSKCRSECTSVTTKFKVQVWVQDESGSVSFVMFDRDVQKLLGLAASDIREKQVKANDTGCFPHEIFRLVDKKVAFKIDVSEFNLKNDYRVYTVQKTCDDPVIIVELVGGDGNGDENTKEVTQEVAEVKDVNLSESSQDAVSVTADFSAVEVEKDSGSSPNGKRIAQDVDVVNIGELSTNVRRTRKKLSKVNN